MADVDERGTGLFQNRLPAVGADERSRPRLFNWMVEGDGGLVERMFKLTSSEQNVGEAGHSFFARPVFVVVRDPFGELDGARRFAVKGDES